MAVRSDFGKFGDTRNTTVQVTHPSTNCREEPSNLHAPRPRHFPSRQRQRQSTGKKSETGPQGVRESAVETFHKRGGGSRVTKAIFCSRSLLTLVRRSSGIGKTERGSKAGSGHNEIRSDIDKYQRTGVTGFFFLLPRTITLRNRIHHRTRLHRTDSPSQQGVLERNADGVKAESDMVSSENSSEMVLHTQSRRQRRAAHWQARRIVAARPLCTSQKTESTLF